MRFQNCLSCVLHLPKWPDSLSTIVIQIGRQTSIEEGDGCLSRYRAVIIGCGDQSVHHARAYNEAGIPVVAGADISQEALEKFRHHTGVETAYTDYENMLDEIRPDLISVATPHQLHCPMVVTVARHGAKGIVCEKPMAMNLAEADRMLDACRPLDTKLIINHQRYYEAPYARARELLAADAIGRVCSVEVHFRSHSALTDGTHAIHMLLSLLGNPRVTHLMAQVDGRSGRRSVFGPRVEDAGIAFLAFENEACAYLTWGSISHKPGAFLHPGGHYRYYQSFIIRGEGGRLEVASDGPEDSPRYLRIVRGAQVEDVAYAGDKAAYDKVTLHRTALKSAIEDLVHLIETDARHPLDGQSGRNVMEVIMAIYESSRRRGVVTVPHLKVKENPFLAMCDAGDFPLETSSV